MKLTRPRAPAVTPRQREPRVVSDGTTMRYPVIPAPAGIQGRGRLRSGIKAGQYGRRAPRALAALMLVAVPAVVVLAGAACGPGRAPAPTATPAVPPGPPSFPFIFSGKFIVAGRPGPSGQKIFARIGNARSPVAETGDGTYRNVILGPARPEDQKGEIAFFLGDPEGKIVQARETYPFQVIGQPQTVELDLTFPSLP